ncbi:MAG: FAD-dependent thymidylate synthase [Firmicutes bacterium]|nr:FAD-dependent thymidylate synthase [Bacillota bacterium]
MVEVELLAVTPDAEQLIELAGRTCYLSHDRSQRGSEERFIRMLLRHGHLSVLEHAYATFRIKGGSRAFTHQIVRHRLASYSQQSQRYVSEASFDYVEPETVMANSAAHRRYVELMEEIKRAYGELQELGVPKEDARFILPNAVTSEIVISANLREWRHIFSVRCEVHAQWEIRTICLQMLELLQEAVPTVFSDFVIDKEKMVARRDRSVD